jgi:hypothetical protein
VDSGNLAGHLLTLRPGLAALPDAAILNRRWVEGVSDTYAVLVDALGKEAGAEIAQFAQFESALAQASATGSASLAAAWVHVHRLAACASDACAGFAVGNPAGLPTEAQFWADALARHCADLRDDLMFLAPWLALQHAPGTVPARDAGDGIPTLRELAALDMLSPLHAKGAARATERIAAHRAACAAGNGICRHRL